MNAIRADLSWITPMLAMGGRLGSTDAEQLARSLGIRRVVDVRLEECDDERVLRRHGIELLHLPTLDRCAVSEAMLWDGVTWVGRQLAAGHKVYIHCEHGIGRSALLVCCVLVSQGHSPMQALRMAKAARAKVSPSPEQLQALLGWSADWHLRTGRPQPPEDWEALARVAWGGG
jgi:hypothetical protein